MLTNAHYKYHGDKLVMYINVKSLCVRHSSIICQLYLNKNLNIKHIPYSS